MLSYRWLFSASCQPVEAIASLAAAVTHGGVIFQGGQSGHETYTVPRSLASDWMHLLGCLTTALKLFDWLNYGSNRILSDFSPFFIISNPLSYSSSGSR